MFPQIYWNHTWHYICHRKFIENNYGVNLFCEKLLKSIDQLENQKNFGELLSYESSKETHPEATFLFGSCTKSDSWPYCTGGCNSRSVGGRCYKKDPTDDKTTTQYYSCYRGKSVKFSIQCRGKYDLPISSCPGNLNLILSLVI